MAAKLRMERLAAGRYRWNHYMVYSVVTAARLKEWRVTWKGSLLNVCGSLALAKETVLRHDAEAAKGEV